MTPTSGPPKRPLPVATALRRAFAQGYRLATLKADLMAGAVVGVVAIPLSMALAIAVDVPPQHGLYTAVVAGIVVAALGGSKHQVTGPTAAFVVVLAPIVGKHGLSGLLTAGAMAGVILVLFGLGRFGRLISYIPHPVTTGFTAGIATVIALLQLKDVLGLPIAKMPDGLLPKLAAMWSARGGASARELVVACLTLALLLVVPKITRRVPAPLVALVLVTVGVTLVHNLSPELSFATIGSRFHATVHGVVVAGIPPVLPEPALPWHGAPLSFATVRELVPAAFAIAMLGAIESLLSAVIADGMTGKKHDPDAELVALGVGNLIAPFFGGIAATGALARTATNIRAGAETPIAAIVHSLVVLLSIVALAPLVAYVPMASLAALLLLVAWNMSEIRHVVRLLRVAPKSDIVVLCVCYFLTVAFDMVVAISVGVVLAALLFMRRMSELTHAGPLDDVDAADSARDLPAGVGLYEINGPLFFGAAKNAMQELAIIHDDRFTVLVISLARCPTIDATGLVALESAIGSLTRAKKSVIVGGPLPAPRTLWKRAKLEVQFPGTTLTENLDEALALAREISAGLPSHRPPLLSAIDPREDGQP